MLKTILLTSGLALTTLFSDTAASQSSALPANVSAQHVSKWHVVKAEFKGDKAENTLKQNHHKKLLKLVGKYAPDSLSQWKQALAQRQDLLSQLKSEIVKKARKENRQSLKSELKAKMKTGELTKKEAIQQFKEQFKQLKAQQKQNLEAKKEIKAELKEAVQKKDRNAIVSILDKKYKELVSKNELLLQKLEKWKSHSTSSNPQNTQNAL